MVLVDKNVGNSKDSANINENKSVFAIGDYRHNLPNKDQSDLHSSKVSQLPKQFLSWDDGAVFNSKYAKDVSKDDFKNSAAFKLTSFKRTILDDHKKIKHNKK
jgi:hypothetical protein